MLLRITIRHPSRNRAVVSNKAKRRSTEMQSAKNYRCSSSRLAETGTASSNPLLLRCSTSPVQYPYPLKSCVLALSSGSKNARFVQHHPVHHPVHHLTPPCNNTHGPLQQCNPTHTMTQEGNHGAVGRECNKFMEQELGTPLMRSVGNRVAQETPTRIDYYLEIVERDGVWVQGSHTAL